MIAQPYLPGSLLAALALVACAGEEMPVPPEPPSDVEMLIGGSSTEGVGFVAIEDGDDVELVPGSQAGFHVWTSLRLKGAEGTLYLDREARRVDDGTLVLRSGHKVYDVPSSAMNEMWEPEDPMASFMCPSPVGIQLYDQEIALTATLMTEDEEILQEAHLVFTPRCPEGEQRDFCLEICGG